MTQTIAVTVPVYVTDDFSIFKHLTGNRHLSFAQVKRLAESIKKNPLLTLNNPVIVNEKMEIIDGQHRLQAHKNLKEAGQHFPVHYVVQEGLTLMEARIMNSSQKPWNVRDYARAYAADGNKNYKLFLEFDERFKLNATVSIVLLTDSFKANAVDFRAGKLEVKDYKRACEIAEQLLEVAQYYHNWPHQAFARSFYKIAKHPAYKHSRMLSQIKEYNSGLNGVPQRMAELVPALNMVYNWANDTKVDLID